MKITHKDVYNLLMLASSRKPYLVYSYRNVKTPRQGSKNVYKGKPVTICWASASEKDSIALVVLPPAKTEKLINDCIYARENRGKTKYMPVLYANLQTSIAQFAKEKAELLKRKQAKTGIVDKPSKKPVVFKAEQIGSSVVSKTSVNIEELNGYVRGRNTTDYNFRVVHSDSDILLRNCGELFQGLALLVVVKTEKVSKLEGTFTRRTARFATGDKTVIYYPISDKGVTYKEDLDKIISQIGKPAKKVVPLHKEFTITDTYLNTYKTDLVSISLETNPEMLAAMNVKSERPLLVYAISTRLTDNKKLLRLNSDKRIVSGLLGFPKATLFWVEVPTYITESFVKTLTELVLRIVEEDSKHVLVKDLSRAN